MEKVNMVCYSWSGARDLYHGVPDLEGAVVKKIEYDPDVVSTVLHMERTNGEIFKLMVRPAEQ